MSVNSTEFALVAVCQLQIVELREERGAVGVALGQLRRGAGLTGITGSHSDSGGCGMQVSAKTGGGTNGVACGFNPWLGVSGGGFGRIARGARNAIL